MLGAVCDHLLEVAAPVVEALAGDGKHQIDVHVGEAATPRDRHGLDRLRRGLQTSQTLQEVSSIGLDADG